MNFKKVFISGGAGVIGRELVSLLIKEKAEIFVGDLQPCPEEFKGKVKYRQGDLNELTKQEISSFNPEIFFHLAATFERSTETYEFWEENYRHNCLLTHHLISLIKDLQSIKKIIFASSYLIYEPKLYQFKTPQEKGISLHESDPVYPRNLIGVAKFSHEIDLRFLNEYKSESYSTISARIYRGYGCNSRDVISRWIRDLIEKHPISVYREEGIFDYIFSKDSAMGLLKLAKIENFNGVVNLGTGKGRKVSEILKILKKYFPEMQIIKIDSDIEYEASQANINLLKSKVNWEPEYSLEKAIPLIIDFEKKRKNLFTQKINSPKVLISSSGKKTSCITAMKTALNKYKPDSKVICGDIDPNCIGKYVADNFLEMPKTTQKNLNSIIDKLIKNEINIVLPSRDGELLFWSKNKNNFRSVGINVIISEHNSIEICLDKLKFYDFGLKNKFNFIKTEKNIQKIDSTRFVVKEQFGSGAKSIGLNLNSQEALAHSKKLRNPIYQPFVEGKEISIDAWLDKNHKVKGVVLRTRDLVVNGESRITTTFFNNGIEKEAIKILEALRLEGPIVLQAIVKENNEIIFLECNTRFGGGSNSSIHSGLDSFYWSILEIEGEDLREYQFHKSNSKIKKIRIPTDIYMNI